MEEVRAAGVGGLGVGGGAGSGRWEVPEGLCCCQGKQGYRGGMRSVGSDRQASERPRVSDYGKNAV